MFVAPCSVLGGKNSNEKKGSPFDIRVNNSCFSDGVFDELLLLHQLLLLLLKTSVLTAILPIYICDSICPSSSTIKEKERVECILLQAVDMHAVLYLKHYHYTIIKKHA